MNRTTIPEHPLHCTLFLRPGLTNFSAHSLFLSTVRLSPFPTQNPAIQTPSLGTHPHDALHKGLTPPPTCMSAAVRPLPGQSNDFWSKISCSTYKGKVHFGTTYMNNISAHMLQHATCEASKRPICRICCSYMLHGTRALTLSAQSVAKHSTSFSAPAGSPGTKTNPGLRACSPKLARLMVRFVQLPPRRGIPVAPHDEEEGRSQLISFARAGVLGRTRPTRRWTRTGKPCGRKRPFPPTGGCPV